MPAQPRSPRRSRRGARTEDRRRRARLLTSVGLAVLGLLTLTGCSSADLESRLRWGAPVGITQQAERIRILWTYSGLTALIVGVIVWALIFWACIVYRRKRGTPAQELPRQTKYNLPIEWAYTIVPFFIIVGLFFYTVRTEDFVNKVSKNPDVLVQVDAFKWNWEFQYIDNGGTATNFASSQTPVNTVGSSEEVPVLVIPVNRRVEFVEHSYDVIHSFWVPEFLFKRDVIPHGAQDVHGVTDTSKDNRFQITTQKTGSYVGRCSELCGTYHSQMNFEVRVVPEDQFRSYVSALSRIGASNPARQALALTAAGMPPYATTTHPFYTDRTARQASGTQVTTAGNPQGK